MAFNHGRAARRIMRAPTALFWTSSRLQKALHYYLHLAFIDIHPFLCWVHCCCGNDAIDAIFMPPIIPLTTIRVECERQRKPHLPPKAEANEVKNVIAIPRKLFADVCRYYTRPWFTLVSTELVAGRLHCFKTNATRDTETDVKIRGIKIRFEWLETEAFICS